MAPPHRHRPSRPARLRLHVRALSSNSSTADLLDAFWVAQGVVDEEQRRRLVDAGTDVSASSSSWADMGAALQQGELDALPPGVSATWFLPDAAAGTQAAAAAPLPAWGEEAGAAQVAEVSRRLVALRQLLGGRADVDVVFMVVREPRLLSADYRSILRRLLELKAARAGQQVDVVKMAEAQPALLLQQSAEISDDESAAEQLAAWRHGLISDAAGEWERRFGELEGYAAQHGDVHVGYREDDDPELSRWAAKQRAAHATGALEGARAERLAAAGFEFDPEAAEWQRWRAQLASFAAEHGHCTPAPLTAGADFLLTNWCAVQRVARRSGVLAPERVAALDALGFDWSGSDPLS